MEHDPGEPAWKNKLFVVGHIAKGVVFGLIGALGTYAVYRGVSDPRGMGDVLVWLHKQPFGKALVTLLGLGLLGHGVWRLSKAFGPVRKDNGTSSKIVAIGERIGHVVGGIFYCSLCVFALSLLWIRPDPAQEKDTRDQLLQFTLEIPWVEWVIGVIGAIIIVVGIILAVRGIKKHTMLDLQKDRMAKWEITFYRTIGMIGHIAWGMINCIIGYFLVRVGITSDPERFRGIKGALEFVGGRTLGAMLLGAVSLGLLLYGLFMFAKARYHNAD